MSEPKLRVMRILWAALLASPAMFLLVGYVVTAERQEQLTPEPFLLPVLGLAALGSAAASVVIPMVLLKPALLALRLPTTDAPSAGPSGGRRRPRRFVDATAALSGLLTAAQAPFIVGLAMAESVALLGFVLWFLGFAFVYVAPFFAVSWALLLSKFPRLVSFESALESTYDADLAG